MMNTEKLTDSQIREARIRMEGERAKRRKLFHTLTAKQQQEMQMQEYSERAALNIPGPVMDLDDELTKVKAERDQLRRALDRATDQLVRISAKVTELEAIHLRQQKHLNELEAALKVKLF